MYDRLSIHEENVAELLVAEVVAHLPLKRTQVVWTRWMIPGKKFNKLLLKYYMGMVVP